MRQSPQGTQSGIPLSLYDNVPAAEPDPEPPALAENNLYYYAEAARRPLARIQELGLEAWLAVSNDEEEGEPDQEAAIPDNLFLKIDKLGVEEWVSASDDEEIPCLMRSDAADPHRCQHGQATNSLCAMIDRLGVERWLLGPMLLEPPTLPGPTVLREPIASIAETKWPTAGTQASTSAYHTYILGAEWAFWFYHQARLAKVQEDVVRGDAGYFLLQTWNDFLAGFTGEKKRLVDTHPRLHQDSFFLGISTGIEALKEMGPSANTTTARIDDRRDGEANEQEKSSAYHAYLLGAEWIFAQSHQQPKTEQGNDVFPYPEEAVLLSAWHRLVSDVATEKKRLVTRYFERDYMCFKAGILMGFETLGMGIEASQHTTGDRLHLPDALVHQFPIGVLQTKQAWEKRMDKIAAEESLQPVDLLQPGLRANRSAIEATQPTPQEILFEESEVVPVLPQVEVHAAVLPVSNPMGDSPSANEQRVIQEPVLPVASPLSPEEESHAGEIDEVNAPAHPAAPTEERIHAHTLHIAQQSPSVLPALAALWQTFSHYVIPWTWLDKMRHVLLRGRRVALSAALIPASAGRGADTIRVPLPESIPLDVSTRRDVPFASSPLISTPMLPTQPPEAQVQQARPRLQIEGIAPTLSQTKEEMIRAGSTAQIIHQPIANDFSRLTVLDMSFLPVNRQVMLAVNQVIPELEELHMQGSYFRAWEGAFVNKVVTGKFASLRLLNVMQSNLSEHSLLQILQAVQQNRLPRLEKLGMDLSSFPVAQRYRQLLFANKYTPLANPAVKDSNTAGLVAPTIQLDLQDPAYTPTTLLRVLLNYLNPGLLQSIVDIQLAGKKLDRPIIALLSTFPALKILNIADSYCGSCRAFALFSQLAKQGAWGGINVQASGSPFSRLP